MAPKGVRDVHAEPFIKAYAAHLKANDKVCSTLAAWASSTSTRTLAQDDSFPFFIPAKFTGWGPGVYRAKSIIDLELTGCKDGFCDAFLVDSQLKPSSSELERKR